MTTSVGLVIPVLNEADSLSALFAALGTMETQADSIVFVDGGSTDGSPDMIETAGFQVIHAERPSRAVQVNMGVRHCSCSYIAVLHADTLPPVGMIRHIRSTLGDRSVALGGFRPVMKGQKLRWATSFHNLIKTWYAPLLFRPHLFFRGCRLLFGDHAMFFRRAEFLAIGGIDENLRVMEEADLCIKIVRVGRTRLLWTPVYSSDRRVAHWGGLRANLIYLRLGILWGLGFKYGLGRHYPDIR